MGLFGEFIDQSLEEKNVEKALSEIEEKIKNIRKQRTIINRCDECIISDQCCNKDYPAFVVGSGYKKIMIIMGSPDRSVRITGNYKSGATYQFLLEELGKLGLDIARDCWITYSVRTPVEQLKDSMLRACRYKLLKTIEILKPEKIITLGSIPLKSILSHRASSRVKLGDIDRWAGWVIPDQDLEAMVYPVYDPDYVCWMKNFILEKQNIQLFRNAIKSKKQFYKNNYSSEYGYIDNEKEAIAWIKECTKARKVVFDYETTGIKCQREGHKILCIGISNGLFSYGFEMYSSREFKSVLADLLISDCVLKVAHNEKYEAKWTKGILGYDVKNWAPDTMLAAHVLDNRKGITGLKLQAYQALGYIGYDNEIAPYMETTKPGDTDYDIIDSANRFNMMEYAPVKEMCLYCAGDAHYTYKLEEIQTATLDHHRLQGLKLLQWATQAYIRMENAGVHISLSKLNAADKQVTAWIFEADQQIQLDPDVAEWRRLRNKEFDHNSDVDLRDYIYKYMNDPVLKRTKKGKEPSVDKDVLKGLIKAGRSTVYSHIEVYRKWDKVKDYINGLKRETVNGVLYCTFNLGFVTTYRTSSSDINLQNIPKRDAVVKKLLRSVFIPRSGHMFYEVDFKAWETVMYAAYSQDENLLTYVKDLTKDMHRDIGSYIMQLSWTEMQEKFGKKGAKLFRQETKSGFIFSQLYGAQAKTCAKYYWDFFQKEEGQIYWEDFSTRTGISDYDGWDAWIEVVENYFWHELFPKLGEWRERNWDRYLKTGRIKYFTGFYVTARMKKTQATNYPIQGTAANVKLALLSLLSDKFERDGVNSVIFAEIHDSVVIDLDPAEIDYVRDSVRWILDYKLYELYPFLKDIPLYMEESLGEIDGSWATVEEGEIINERR